MILGLSIFIALFTLSWVAYPLLFDYHRHRLPDALAKEQEASLLRALKTHYESIDPESDDSKNDDFKNIERRIMLRLARLYQRHQWVPVAPVGPSPEEVPTDEVDIDPISTATAEPEPVLACHVCHSVIRADFVHCPSCGVKL